MTAHPLSQPPARFALTGARLTLPGEVVSSRALLVKDGRIAAFTAPDELGDDTAGSDLGGRYVDMDDARRMVRFAPTGPEAAWPKRTPGAGISR